jgi:hypothetical protein
MVRIASIPVSARSLRIAGGTRCSRKLRPAASAGLPVEMSAARPLGSMNVNAPRSTVTNSRPPLRSRGLVHPRSAVDVDLAGDCDADSVGF